MNPERFSTFTESVIGALVDRFYAKVRRDPALGPVFEEAIAEEDWPEHLATMRRFSGSW